MPFPFQWPFSCQEALALISVPSRSQPTAAGANFSKAPGTPCLLSTWANFPVLYSFDVSGMVHCTRWFWNWMKAAFLVWILKVIKSIMETWRITYREEKRRYKNIYLGSHDQNCSLWGSVFPSKVTNWLSPYIQICSTPVESSFKPLGQWIYLVQIGMCWLIFLCVTSISFILSN